MAKGDYLGGGTVIRPEQQADWFGDGSEEDPAYQPALKKYQNAKAAYRKIEAERGTGASRLGTKSKEYTRQLRAAYDVMEAARPRPTAVQSRKNMSAVAEQRISQLKRDLAVHATQVRNAITAHEACRQELIGLLAAHGLPEANYPETRKLML